MSKVYRLDHYYNIGNQGVYFSSDEDLEIIKKKAVFIQFRAEEIINESVSLTTGELADILLQNINAKEIKTVQVSKAQLLDMYFIREEFCPVANEIELEMNHKFDLSVLDHFLRKTEDAKYFI